MDLKFDETGVAAAVFILAVLTAIGGLVRWAWGRRDQAKEAARAERIRVEDAARADREITRGLYRDVLKFADNRMRFIDDCMAFVRGYRDKLPDIDAMTSGTEYRPLYARLELESSDAVATRFQTFGERHLVMFGNFGMVKARRSMLPPRAAVTDDERLKALSGDLEQQYRSLVDAYKDLKEAMRREQKVLA